MRCVAAVFSAAAALAASAIGPAGAIVNGELDGNRHPQVAALVGDLPPYAYNIPFCTGRSSRRPSC